MFEGFDYSVHYGILDPVSILNTCGPPSRAYIDRLNHENGFYDRLLASVTAEGVRNPILVTSNSRGVRCDRHGGSRLWVAQRLGLPIPCLISDWVGRFRDLEELATREAVLAMFRDQPESLLANQQGLHVLNLPQVHLTED